MTMENIPDPSWKTDPTNDILYPYKDVEEDDNTEDE
jgi:hypothetical protein